MLLQKKREQATYGIIGLGRFGHALAVELANSGAELLVIDKDEERFGNCVNTRKTLSSSIRWTRIPLPIQAFETVMW